MSETLDFRPSATRAFFSGFGSGALSGAAMMGIVAVLTPIFFTGAGIVATFMASAPLMSLAAGLFGGIMSAKTALFDSTPPAPAPEPTPITVNQPEPEGPAPKVAQQPEAPTPPTKNWVASTASSQTQNTVQKIIENGSLSDKARADAIYEARLAGANAERTV